MEPSNSPCAQTRSRCVRAGLALLLGSAVLAACGSDATLDRAGEPRPTVEFVAPPSFDPDEGSPTDGIAELEVQVIAAHPHDDEAYTQGLVFAGADRLYETTGRYGSSTLREVAIATGETMRSSSFDDDYFGEGLALSDGRLVALTWREQTALEFDATSFEQIGTFGYDTEGWGLCDDGSRLVMSDGSATLTFRDQQTFEPVGSVEVTIDGVPRTLLNELECVDGLVYANVYRTDQIVVIDPGTGRVVGIVTASGLLDPEADEALEDDEVLNGIAYDPDRGTFYLTGKNWPELFEVRFAPSE